MPIEIEAKIKVDSHEPTRVRLKELGASLAHRWLETNVFLDSADHALRSAGKGLRVRTMLDLDTRDWRTVITFKGPRAAGLLKSREEIELDGVERDAARALLNSLGFRPTLTFEKRRDSWRLDDCLVELDLLPHLGTYVEIEGPSESSVLQVRARLDLAGLPLITESYAGLLSGLGLGEANLSLRDQAGLT